MRYFDRARLYFRNHKPRKGYLLPSMVELTEATEDIVRNIEEQVPEEMAPSEVSSPQLTDDEELESFQADIDAGEGEIEADVQAGVEEDPESVSEPESENLEEELAAMIGESVGSPQTPTPHQVLPESVMKQIQSTDTFIEDVSVISSDEEYWQARDKWGLPNSINESGDLFGVFGSKAGSIFIDDMGSGKVKAYAPSEFPSSRIRPKA